MTASPMLFGKPSGFNINEYNMMRNACMNQYGYTYAQLFGKKFWQLVDLYYNNDAAVHYSITGKKRHWLRMQLDKVVDYLDLYEG